MDRIYSVPYTGIMTIKANSIEEACSKAQSRDYEADGFVQVNPEDVYLSGYVYSNDEEETNE